MSSYAPGPLRHAWRFASVAALVALTAAPAVAQVTFEELATAGPVSYVGNCTSSGGLTFTAVGLGCDVADAFAVYGPPQAAFYSGSAALFNNLTAGVQVTTGGMMPFSLTSVSLTPGLGALSFEPTTVMFTGMVNGGGTVMQSFTLAAGMLMPTTASLTGFSNLMSFTYEVTSPAYDGVQIDNIVYSTGASVVPEPATVLLLGSGLAGLAVFARRRQRQ